MTSDFKWLDLTNEYEVFGAVLGKRNSVYSWIILYTFIFGEAKPFSLNNSNVVVYIASKRKQNNKNGVD